MYTTSLGVDVIDDDKNKHLQEFASTVPKKICMEAEKAVTPVG